MQHFFWHGTGPERQLMETAYSLVQFRSVLQGLGYLPATNLSQPCDPDSTPIDLLSEAIQAFQQDYQLVCNGQLDTATQERARQLVRNLQHSLNLVVQAQLTLNGFYNRATIRAIEVFQQQRGIVVTGIADHGLRRVLEQEVKQWLRSQMAAEPTPSDTLKTSAAL